MTTRTARYLAMGFGLFSVTTGAFAQSYLTSPYSYSNSPYNYDNSSLNYKNSPLNYDNSSLNSRSTNGIYSEGGDRIGYGVQRSDGGVNFFDNGGNRIGFQPGR